MQCWWIAHWPLSVCVLALAHQARSIYYVWCFLHCFTFLLEVLKVLSGKHETWEREKKHDWGTTVVAISTHLFIDAPKHIKIDIDTYYICVIVAWYCYNVLFTIIVFIHWGNREQRYNIDLDVRTSVVHSDIITELIKFVHWFQIMIDMQMRLGVYAPNGRTMISGIYNLN